MKTATAGLNTHIQGETTTLAQFWKVKRTDGSTFHFTSHDQDLDIDIGDGDGEATYEAETSFKRSAIANNDELSVDNLDVQGLLASDKISETELRRGLFDFAEVWVFIANYESLGDGFLRMRRGWFGEVTITPKGIFRTELRGMTQVLARVRTNVYNPECPHDLGDTRCKVPILPEVAVRNKAYVVGDYVRAASELEVVPNSTMLVHGDNGAEDTGSYGGTPTFGTQAAVQSVVTKYGPEAIEFSPSGSVNPSQGFVNYGDAPAIGTAEFTIECWLRFKSNGTVQTFASKYLNTGNQREWGFRFNQTAGLIDFFAYSNGSTLVVNRQSAAFVPTVGVFYHMAVSRDAAGDIRLFIDGTLSGTNVNYTGTIFNGTAPMYLGKLRSAGFDDQPFDGFLEDFRFTIGSALYTANFTPPARLQSISEAVAALLCEAYDDRIYVCTTAGTTDAIVQPAYDTTLTNTTADGGAVFTAEEAWSRCVEVTALGSDPRKNFTVTELTPNSGGTTAGRDFFPDDSLNGGVVVFETGDNAGRGMEIKNFVADDGVTITQDIDLFLQMPFDVQVGDKARVYRGCDKSRSTCRDIFANARNFGGFPDIPGQNVFTYPDAKS